MSKNYFIFDKNKCDGCEACVVACINENGFQETERWRTIHSSDNYKLPGQPSFYLSMACNHCEDAPCMEYCPALAYYRSPLTGAVLHKAEACIGCKYCTWTCPYDAPKYNPASGIINKCNFCESRIADRQKPACASLCPTGALDFSFEEIDKSNISPGVLVPVETRPSILFKELLKESGPGIDHTLFEGVFDPKPDLGNKAKITALKEWTLVFFTLIVSVLVSITMLNFLHEQTLDIKIAFLAVGASAAGLSLLHLGKPLRAWRAFLNIRKSWLSREILFFTLFYMFTAIDLLVFDFPNWLLIGIGFLLLISIDKLYQPAQLYWKYKLHSAQVIFIALSYYFLCGKFFWVFGLIMIFRIVLMLIANEASDSKDTYLTPGKIIRFLSVALTLFSIVGGFPMWNTLLVFTVGEIMDRISFYNELEVPDIDRALGTKTVK